MSDPVRDFGRWIDSADLGPAARAAAMELLREIGMVPYEPSAPAGPPPPAADPPPAPRSGPDFLADYPPEMREAALDRLRESSPETYRIYAARYRALAVRS